MTDEPAREPLPASVSEYTIEYPGATPAQIMAALDLDAQYCAQLEYYCAVTRYTLFRDEDGCDLPEDVQLKTVTWADVVDWEIPAEDRPPATSTE